MLSGFKTFIARGNVVDLAVGVVMGAAFGLVVSGLVESFINPLIAWLVGKPNFDSLMFSLLCLRGQLSDSGGTPGSVPRASPQGSCEPNVVPPRWTEVYRASRGPTSVSGRRAGRIDQVTLYPVRLENVTWR